MKKNLAIMGLLFSIFIAQSVFALTVSEEFGQDDTTLESATTTPVGTPSFGQDDTTLESATTTPVIETPEETNTVSNRRNGGSRRTTSTPAGNLAGGEVLGASTDAGSCKLLTTYMKIGQENNVEEVKALQTFLNTKMNAGLPVTGFFGPLTFQAVKNFQTQYKEEILKPWVEAGLMTDMTATGYVYKTTLYAINKMLCPEATLEMPVLN